MQVKTASIRDGFFYSLMVGIGETYFPAYAIALDFGTWGAALVAVMPVVIGAVLQFSSFVGPQWLRSKKVWVVLCASTQAVSLLALALLSYFSTVSLGNLIFLASIYWAAGFSAGPPWNAWMGQVISRLESVSFFAKRSRISQWATLLGVVVGGFFLQNVSEENPAGQFLFLFLIAGVSRLLSAFFLSRHPRDTPRNLQPIRFSLILKSQHSVLLFYGFLSALSVHISAPYCTPYMLENLGVSYESFMIITASAFVARMVGYEWAGKWIQSRGLLFAAMIGMGGVALVPFFWPFVHTLPELVIFHVAGGVSWALQDIAVFLLFFHHFEENERSRLLTLSNFINALGMAAGTILGGYWMGLMGDSILGTNSYDSLFYLSGAMRLLPLALTPLIFAPGVPWRVVFIRTLGVRPQVGAMDRPVLYPDEGGPSRPRQEP